MCNPIGELFHSLKIKELVSLCSEVASEKNMRIYEGLNCQ